MSDTKPPALPGRPPAVISRTRLAELSGLGLTQDQCASRLGISTKTLAKYITIDPELHAAWYGGKAVAIETATKTLWDRAMAGDTACLIFWLKCQAGWSPPRQDIKVTVATSGTTIDGHVIDMLSDHSRLLDGPSPDDLIPDAEIVD